MACEFVGTFSTSEKDRISGVLASLGGSLRTLLLPRWIILKDDGSYKPLYVVVDTVMGGTCHGGTPEPLVEDAEQRFGSRQPHGASRHEG
jgi:hypothetical protein